MINNTEIRIETYEESRKRYKNFLARAKSDDYQKEMRIRFLKNKLLLLDEAMSKPFEWKSCYVRKHLLLLNELCKLACSEN